VGLSDGESSRIKRAGICHKARKDLRAGFFWLEYIEMSDVVHDTWWVNKRDLLLRMAKERGDAYVYDLATIESAAHSMLALNSVSRVLYAMKANSHPDVLRTLSAAGTDFDCVSPGEVDRLQHELPDRGKDRILFTPNFAPRDEYAWGVSEGLRVTLDNLYPLQKWPELFAGQRLFVRLDPDHGGGHHEHVVTVGKTSKFGISLDEIEALKHLVAECGASIVGIHAHSGSGILDPNNWHAVAATLVEAARHFPDVSVLDLGGGIGVADKRTDSAFDLQALDQLLSEFKAANSEFELWLEPGRFLVSPAGVLLTRVTQLKNKGDVNYVGVSTGMNALIRPALYDAYHEIVNLTKLDDEPTETVNIVGPICETGDKLGTNRAMPPCEEGDIILIANVGAYGHVMSSRYNLRDVPQEITI
jgi:diaminopimelate decarboxylase/aspartate kinase